MRAAQRQAHAPEQVCVTRRELQTGAALEVSEIVFLNLLNQYDILKLTCMNIHLHAQHWAVIFHKVCAAAAEAGWYLASS